MQEITLKFEPEAVRALTIMEKTNTSLFFTWKAGAGKSTLINYFISKTKKSFILLGTTGVAALNIGGSTIHSFFGIIPGEKRVKMTSEKKKLIRITDIFIIDESSMLRADLLDKLNEIMQGIMGNEDFMGGKQFVFVWDLFQLPPVAERDEELKAYYEEKYKGLFFFDGNSFFRENIEIVELTKVYRQDDPQFINMLNRVRVWDNSQDVLDYFNSRVVQPDQVNPISILIGMTNNVVDTKNREEMKKLPTPEEVSYGILKGEFDADDLPVEKYLKLKVGARIMITINDNLERQYMNGTLGTITQIKKSGDFVSSLIVVLDEGGEIELRKNVWRKTDWVDEFDEPIVVGTYTQFPVKLAFAITSHKAQGKSFDHVVIDFWWGAFAEGQTYVALSRCRSFSGLQLLKPITKKDIKVSFNVLKFMKK